MNEYSEDLRKKIVDAVCDRGVGKSDAARAFGVSLSSVKRYVSMARKGEPLAPKKRPGAKRKLDDVARWLLAEDVAERPFLTHSERSEYLRVVAGISVSASTVCRELKRMERTRSKGRESG